MWDGRHNREPSKRSRSMSTELRFSNSNSRRSLEILSIGREHCTSLGCVLGVQATVINLRAQSPSLHLRFLTQTEAHTGTQSASSLTTLQSGALPPFWAMSTTLGRGGGSSLNCIFSVKKLIRHGKDQGKEGRLIPWQTHIW